jgi:DNA-binding CsgD family transcriptional regulator
MLTFWLRQLLVWGAAGLTIFVSYRLYRRYRRRYLRDWFLFVVVFNFGLYVVDLLQSVFPSLIHGDQPAVAHMEMALNALLVRPLIFVGLLLFLRFAIGLSGLRPRRGWRLAAFFLLLADLLVPAFLATRLFFGGRQDAYAAMMVASDWLAIAGLYGAVAFLMVQTERNETEPRRQMLRNLGIIFFLCQTVLVFFPSAKPLWPAGFFLILPPLLYLWRIHGVLLEEQRGSLPTDADLALFLREFGLTEREIQIVGLICRGRDNRALADELYVSIHTVKHHVTAIFRKLKVKSRLQLVNLASGAGRRED